MNLLELKENQTNPRVCKGKESTSMLKMIQQHPAMMELRPIVISEDKTILGGNMRFLALKVLGFTEIPDNWVVVAKNLTPEQQKRFMLLDNIHFGEWDFDVLDDAFDSDDLESADFYLKDKKKKTKKQKSKNKSDYLTTCPKCGKTW